MAMRGVFTPKRGSHFAVRAMMPSMLSRVISAGTALSGTCTVASTTFSFGE